MAPAAKCLPWKHEDPSLIPSLGLKAKDIVVHARNPRRRILLFWAPWSASLFEFVSSRFYKELYFKEKKRIEHE